MPDEVVVGLDSFLDALEATVLNLGEKRKLIAKSLRAGAEPIRQRASDTAPRDTGRLAENIGISVVDQTALGAEARIGPDVKVFYGLFSEVGTVHETAHPWLGPAYDAMEEEAYEIIAEVLSDGIEDSYVDG